MGALCFTLYTANMANATSGPTDQRTAPQSNNRIPRYREPLTAGDRDSVCGCKSLMEVAEDLVEGMPCVCCHIPTGDSQRISFCSPTDRPGTPDTDRTRSPSIAD